MRYRIFTSSTFTLSVLVLLSGLNLYAGTGKRQGTASAMELLIPVGSRGTALGGNFTAGISGIEAMYWNPAGMAASDKGVEFLAMHMRYIADISLNYAGVQAQFEKVGVLGISLKTLDFGDIPVTTEYAPDGTGEIFSPTYITFGASYSRAMTDRIFFGLTAKMISENIMNVSATGIAFDFGVQYATEINLKLGVALRNLGTSMRFDGSDLERRVFIPGYVDDPVASAENLRIISQAFELPTTIDIGVSYTMNPMEGHAVTTMGNFRNHHFGFDGYGVGVEYMFETENIAISLRGAASLAHNVEENKFIFMDDQHIFGPSFGGGFCYQIAPKLSVSVDYAYQLTERFSNLQWISIILGF